MFSKFSPQNHDATAYRPAYCQIGDPLLALGNCWAAANEDIDEAGASAFGA
ncbi:hypothetical protein [Arthrobacter sp. TE12232]